MIQFNFKTSCYSCSGCVASCPTGAIRLDSRLLPAIDSTLCVNCGKCEKVCQALIHPTVGEINSSARGYIARNRDDSVRRKSSSGGIFYSLAKYFVENGGYVCGCVYDKSFMPHHIVSNQITDIEAMLGSKYVQSDMENCINDIRRLLAQGEKVLFSGVPCQIGALRLCIGDSEKLFIVSVVCHGVIARDIWKAYLDIESLRGKITAVTMREKITDWSNYGLKFTFHDGSTHLTLRKSNGYFLKCFTDGLMQKDRCLDCKMKSSLIQADILLGDAWGAGNAYPELADSLGASAIICLTDRGWRLIEAIQAAIQKKEIAVTKIVASNPRIITPAPKNSYRKKFLRAFNKKPELIQDICQQYSRPILIIRIIQRMRNFMQKKLIKQSNKGNTK